MGLANVSTATDATFSPVRAKLARIPSLSAENCVFITKSTALSCGMLRTRSNISAMEYGRPYALQ